MTRARFEIIPADDIGERAARAFPDPSAVTLTVTSLPKHGTERTVDGAVALAGRGFRVVPHLAARNVEGRAALERVLERMGEAGIDEAFVISGDASSAAGTYSTSLELIRDAREISPGLALDIAGYPEGHPHLSDESIERHLRERAPFIRSIVTQMCFDVDAVVRYADRLRETGITADLWAGVPGPVERSRLLTLGARIGVGSSLGFLKRSTSVAGGLLRGRRFDPSAFVARLEAAAGDRLAGLHVYTFNELDSLAAFG
ncbi:MULTISPECIES: methylenetetrahydrofolate reductase [unclassified Rathayibacter]|uniref:methylenetetrahydrofolate reductase n=1 Tax=unclassified Rathayibacter TaxID=2609250 RepID=UPI000CE81EB0|nr:MULTISPECIES: methylenetetrahydrofolate reductase [unclassified Rathayibacter]PPF13286.1 methylenetetrahydrofolate reductase [Rathayibacter sp. AY1A4]PPG75215.1 methylenetetrahydrofolate reductase [Rathayibacter sp. AY1E5]PPH26792.1 methylenetetrahydrofolate reductase [Rathayibacter sp. AY1C3]PPH58082.1 methylenetetrahydrofolate reductase [Rathayibacter sp. AY1D7]PPH58085.1 methylenetetrahydrofolate reductase [Rathayibacter sp. AY1D7]